MFEEIGGPNQIVLACDPAAMNFRIGNIMSHAVSNPPTHPAYIDAGRLCSNEDGLRAVPLVTSLRHQFRPRIPRVRGLHPERSLLAKATGNPVSHDHRRAPLKLAVVVVSQLLGDLISVKEGIGKPFVEITAISTFPRAIRSDNEHKLGSFGHGQPGCGKGAYRETLITRPSGRFRTVAPVAMHSRSTIPFSHSVKMCSSSPARM